MSTGDTRWSVGGVMFASALVCFACGGLEPPTQEELAGPTPTPMGTGSRTPKRSLFGLLQGQRPADRRRRRAGKEAVSAFIQPTEAERAYYMAMPTANRPPGYLDALGTGELEKRALAAKRWRRRRVASYFMAANNLAGEAILGRAGILYFVCKKGCHFCQYRDLPELSLDAEGIAARMLALQKRPRPIPRSGCLPRPIRRCSWRSAASGASSSCSAR